MRTIYIDADFKCHVTNDGTMAAVETDFFDGKCDAYVEGQMVQLWSEKMVKSFLVLKWLQLGKIMTNWMPYSVITKNSCLQNMNLHWLKLKLLWGCNT